MMDGLSNDDFFRSFENFLKLFKSVRLAYKLIGSMQCLLVLSITEDCWYRKQQRCFVLKNIQ